MHCIYGDWEKLPCTVTCGGGIQKFTRNAESKDVRISCPKHDYEHIKECNTQPCPIDCQWSSWSKFAECSETCGGGYQIFKRTHQVKSENGGKDCEGDHMKVEKCKKHPCPGKFFHILYLSDEFRILPTYKHF